MSSSAIPPAGPPPRALQLPFPRPGPGAPQYRSIPPVGLVLGRGLQVFQQPFADPAMAARHAEIRLDGAAILVEDLGTAAGTRVNGLRVHGPHPLAQGDVVRLGDTSLVVTNPDRAPVAEARPAGVEALELTGETRSIEAVRRSIETVAAHRRTVLVTGETGTGKEIVARLLHQRSARAGPFVAVNCGGFTEGLLASELFGHIRGAFTGAVTDHEGLFRAARGGTLLLDEVSELPLVLQTSLLRVLEAGEVHPVGASHDVAVDVRVVTASNRDLAAQVRKGQFRANLYARLAQWVIRMPPLRDRREDIPLLTQALLGTLACGARTLAPDLEEALLVHPWPLNVRGLSNVLSIASIASPPGRPLSLGPEVEAALEDGYLERAPAPPALAYAASLDGAALEDLLLRFHGRVAEMARYAGVSRSRMYRLLWAEGLDPARFRGGS